MVETDVLIVGAGPVGLFQVFQLGLLEVRAQVVDALPHIGGQCLELYADKPIYDIPALPHCTGRELIERLERQIAPFGAGFHLGQLVSGVQRRDDGRFDVSTDAGREVVARAIVVAAGVGAFQPRRLKLDGLETDDVDAVHYRDPGAEATHGRRVVVAGNGEAAVAAALAAVDAGAASVTLIHRRDDLDASHPLRLRFEAARTAGTIVFVAGRPTALLRTDGRPDALSVEANDGTDLRLPLDLLLVMLGWSPKLGPIADWGIDLERKQVRVDTERFETSTPGIHAVGDINVYPGKRKLIVSGFHEATLAAYAIAERIHPDRAQPLLYTTTSPKLHRLLGVAPALDDPALP